MGIFSVCYAVKHATDLHYSYKQQRCVYCSYLCSELFGEEDRSDTDCMKILCILSSSIILVNRSSYTDSLSEGALDILPLALAIGPELWQCYASYY